MRIAGRTPAVRTERRRYGGLEAIASYDAAAHRWQVDYVADGEVRVQVEVADRTGRVIAAWTGIQARWPIARPLAGKFGHRLNAPYVWIPLCVLFVLPFFDPRRPFRLLHLDLLVLLAFGVSHAFFNRGEIVAAVPLWYPVLAYLLVRMLVAGFRPRGRHGPLVPLLPAWVLVAGLIFLVGFRVSMNVADSGVTDVGYAGVIGADRILRGDPLYDGRFPEQNPSGDTYGPVAYLAYLPFTLAFGWSGAWDELPAAHAASIAFDLLTIVALLLLGRAVRAGPEGLRLGLALAFAWAAYPYTAYVLQANTNDALIAALLVMALAFSRTRGVWLVLAGAAKLAPLALLPLFATAARGRRPRAATALRFAAVAGVVVLVVVVPFVAEVGPAQAYARTLGFQLARESPFSVWGLEPALVPLQRLLQGATIALAVVVAFRPRRTSPAQVAALGAAVLIALEAVLTHWFYLYIVWFLPYVLLALFDGQGAIFARSRRAADAEPVLLGQPAGGGGAHHQPPSQRTNAPG